MKNILSLDYGEKRIGIATSKDNNIFAFAGIPIQNTSRLDTLKSIEKIVKKEGIELIIIGLPLGFEGRETEMTKKIIEFKHQLVDFLKNIEILFWNEVMTSKSAKINLGKSKKSIDSESARIILQEYLDFNNEKNG